MLVVASTIVYGEVMKSDKYQLEAQTKVENTVATVNGEAIKSEDFVNRLVQLDGNRVLSLMVDEVLLKQEISNKKVKIVDKDIEERLKTVKTQFGGDEEFTKKLKESGASVDMLKKQIEFDLSKEKLVSDEIKVSSPEVTEFFNTNKEKLGKPEAVHLRHILVSTEQEANDILIALNAGANFEALAKLKSLDSSTKDKGGDLGFLAKGLLAPQLEKVAFEMKVGDLTPVTRTDLGFHVFKLEEKQMPAEAKFDKDMKDKIAEAIKQQKLNKSLTDLLQNLRKSAKIEVKQP
jgi:foldase protein PrsA